MIKLDTKRLEEYDIDSKAKIMKEKLEIEEILKMAEKTQQIKDSYDRWKAMKNKNSIPGIYERHMMDILDYLQAKFPQLGKDELMEAVGCISNRTMVVVNDILAERDREWKKEMNRVSKAYERELRSGKVSRRDLKKSDVKEEE